MGLYSWKTADTGQAILVAQAGMPPRTAYLLQPDGEAPVAEPAYRGDGMFGGVDAYVWVARRNLADRAQAAGMRERQLRAAGVQLCHGWYFIDRETNRNWSVYAMGAERFADGVTHFPGQHDEPVPGYGTSPNELVESGRWRKASLLAFMRLPLKLSFDPTAIYENLPASPVDDRQGFPDGNAS